MKIVFVISKIFVILYFFSFAEVTFASSEKYQEQSLFQCVQDQGDLIEVSIHRRIQGIGPQKFVGQIKRNGIPKLLIRLNLTEIYEGRILFFTSGDLRVRFDRVQMIANKVKAFVQIPTMKIYSDEWTCKGPTFNELPTLTP